MCPSPFAAFLVPIPAFSPAPLLGFRLFLQGIAQVIQAIQLLLGYAHLIQQAAPLLAEQAELLFCGAGGPEVQKRFHKGRIPPSLLGWVNINIIETKIQVFERTNHIREEMSKDEEKNFKSN